MKIVLDHTRRPFNPRLPGASRIIARFTQKARWRGIDARFAALIMLIAVLWLATRPYQGVIQDARFYMVQALQELHPERFVGDPYFRFGSVNRFTIFSRSYAPLLAILGVGPTEMILTIAGQLLWVGGLLYLAHALIRDRWHALLAVAVVIALPSDYGFFLYGEPFATPRLFAEALTMIALGCLVQRRTGWALAVLAVAVAIHPLMTLPGLAIALIYLALGRPLWWAVIAGGAMTTAGLAIAGVQPFANLRVTMDPQWFDIVKIRDRMCFLTNWHANACLPVLGAVALAILALVLAELRERRLLWMALIIGIGGLLATLIGADLLHNVFIIEIQQYRAIWPLTLLASLSVVPIFIRLLYLGDPADLTRLGYFIAIVILFLSRFVFKIIFAATPLMIVTSILAIWQYRTGRQLPFLARGCYMVVLGICCAATILLAIMFKNFMEPWPEEFFHRMYSLALAALAIIFVIVVQTPPAGNRYRRSDRALPWLAAALLPVALLGWDVRTPWTRFVESSRPAPASLTALVPRNASVYWEGDVRMVWLRLQRPSYFSCSQGTGATFFRETAVLFQHREDSFWPLRTLDFDRNLQCPHRDKTDKPNRTRTDLQRVCRREPGLDYLVLIRPIENIEPKIWISPVPFQYERIVNGKLIARETHRFFIYSCSGLR